MKSVAKILILAVLALSACKESPKQEWQRASNKFREASKLYLTLAGTLNPSAKVPSPNQTPNSPDLAGLSAAYNADQCAQMADNLDKVAEAKSAKPGEITVLKSIVADILKTAEKLANEQSTAGLGAEERQKCISAYALVKEANEAFLKGLQAS